MFSSMIQYVFAGAYTLEEKFFCMLLFMFCVELLVGIIEGLIKGARSR